jgi:GntR family transcriptional regulator
MFGEFSGSRRMKQAATLGFRPLYQQVREALTQRIADGRWKAGQIVPSEFQIAAEIGVSQGTVRKALDDMTAARLLVRRQGKGTFVATHDEARILFQFFKLKPDAGGSLFPESEVLSVVKGSANPEETRRLQLPQGQHVLRIRRVRSLSGARCIIETIVLPLDVFDGLQNADIPNNLYSAYAEHFGITIAGGSETLKAVAAETQDANVLGVPVGHPLLAIDRIATSLDGKPMEWRLSLCRTDSIHYATELS